MNTFPIPAYVDPAVLEPGQTVVGVLDGAQTPLLVLRVEPAIICRTPDGNEVVLLAHEAVTADPDLSQAGSVTREID
jgi:hypothetical protein